MSSSLSSLPLAPPPPGVTPNFVNPESRTDQIYVISAVWLAFMILMMMVRMYAKFFVLRSRTWDDYACLGAMAGIIAYVGLTIAEVQTGYGKHKWNTTVGEFTNEHQIETVVSVAIYGPVIFLVKLAIFLLLLHLFSRLRWLRYLVYTGIAITGLFYFSGVIVAFVLCGPSPGQDYLAASMTPRCMKLARYGVAQGVANVLSDFYLLFIPIPAIWSLQLPTRKKIGVSSIFMTGLFACIVSCVSLRLRVLYQNTTDITWDVITLFIMSIVEMNVGLIVACMPSVATVVHHHGAAFSAFFDTLGGKFHSFSSKLPSITITWKRSAKDSSHTPDSTLSSRSGESYRPLKKGSVGSQERRDWIVDQEKAQRPRAAPMSRTGTPL
ncbi:hypothetical protein MMC24_002780 [Lignoscripta atroalba]|nr:hypothetical protein [Lignoscripta atroalba]